MKNAVRQLKIVQHEFNQITADIRLYRHPSLAGHIGLQYFHQKAFLFGNADDLLNLVRLLKKKAPGKKAKAEYNRILKSNFKYERYREFRYVKATIYKI